MVDFDADGEESFPGARARVLVRCLVRLPWKIWLSLEFLSGFDLRVKEKLCFSITVRHG